MLEAVLDHLRLEARIGGYEAADRNAALLERAYQAAAALIGASPDEIALVDSATRAWDMAFYSVPLRPGDRILCSMAEYASNYIAFLHAARRTGARVEVVPDDEHGQLSVQALKAMMDERVRLVAITHVPTNGGLVNPAAEVGRVARQAGALYLLDACQSVGQLPVDVDAIGCDMLATTGRKWLRGPRGTGFLYVRREALERLEPAMLDFHAATWVAPDRYEVRPDARRFETWEADVAARVGLGAAIDYALSWGIEAIWQRVRQLADTLRVRLAEIPGVTVRDLGQVRCGIVTFTVEGLQATDVRQALLQERINVSVSRASATLLDMQRRGLSELVRASVHYYNTEDEIDRFCQALRGLPR